MGVSTLYLGDSKLADKQVAAWAKNELEKAKLEKALIKDIYSDLKKIKRTKLVIKQKNNKTRIATRKVV